MTAAHWSTTMTAPQYISDDKSDMRGIKPGWYAMDEDGNLGSGPFSSHEECLFRITEQMSGSNPSMLRSRPK
jgi:hypothetical protein